MFENASVAVKRFVSEPVDEAASPYSAKFTPDMTIALTLRTYQCRFSGARTGCPTATVPTSGASPRRDIFRRFYDLDAGCA